MRLHGKCGATYESGSLRRYHLGRTEIIRSCTIEAQKFAQAMSEKHNETSSDSKYTLFLNAVQAQRQYTNDVKQNFLIEYFFLLFKSFRHLMLKVLIDIY